jgi:hypothetical protein
MADKSFGWEQCFAVVLILITLAAMAWFPSFSNADISVHVFVIALLALLLSIARKRDISR